MNNLYGEGRRRREKEKVYVHAAADRRSTGAGAR